ncbi:hypothetical protein EN780_03465 [Mesorhizobium sp. M4B.F.Ca.ET.089.01.1.1]|uniref:hypothetical protein n=1 Tax=Mesorhizobium sp. M4B.F.Ca.ET.089.01.1.1 TaxID=2496662 RepID=UPI000FE424AE|nr:hypothetical protein [Mesorhizobium sp. M4B.F.Ca.ET.089.01.1.1]RWX70466.1 hypothetical protein EN780_03465 [Mesorhizobium sp. M4B.F.Ca.ET.089.01.1.1]
MKLGELRAAIRKSKETPYVNIFPFPGTDKGFCFHLQKTPLLAELERVYPGGKGVETGLEFDGATGKLHSPSYQEASGTSDADRAAAFEGVQRGAIKADDDLLGDEPAAAKPASDDDLSDLLV